MVTCEHRLHANLLDLETTFVDGIYEYKLYEKRDNYPFFIAHMSDLFGNIPTYVFYDSILSEILKIAKCPLKLSHLFQKLNICF